MLFANSAIFHFCHFKYLSLIILYFSLKDLNSTIVKGFRASDKREYLVIIKDNFC